MTRYLNTTLTKTLDLLKERRPHITTVTVNDEANRISLLITCPVERHTGHHLHVNANALMDWISGRSLIHDALYALNDEQRELLMTGMCDVAWDALMPDDDDQM